MRRFLVVRLLALSFGCGLLCACAGPQLGEQIQIDAYDDARCAGYGLKPIDPEYAQCRYALVQMRYPGDPQGDLAAITLENLARRARRNSQQ